MSKRRLNFLQRKMKRLEHDFQKMPAFLQAHSIMVANYAQCLFLLAQGAPDRRMPHAMTAGRPYQKAISRQQALRTISEGAGNQFDPILAGLFCAAQRNA